MLRYIPFCYIWKTHIHQRQFITNCTLCIKMCVPFVQSQKKIYIYNNNEKKKLEQQQYGIKNIWSFVTAGCNNNHWIGLTEVYPQLGGDKAASFQFNLITLLIVFACVIVNNRSCYLVNAHCLTSCVRINEKG